MSLLFLLLDKSRENYRDVVCTVMRQLLRKCLIFCPPHPFTSCSHNHRDRKVYIILQGFWISFNFSVADYILEHSEDDTKSLFSIIKVGVLI